MLKIISDNKKAEKALQIIAGILNDQGAFVDPDIEIHCKDGSLSVYSPKNKTQRPMFRIPHGALIPFDQFKVEIKKDRFTAKPINKDLPKHQIRLMEAMMELYNVTGQLERHHQTCPWIVFKDVPRITDMLLQCRQGEDIHEIRELLNSKNDDNALEMFTFFRTRLLKCRLYKKFRKPSTVLLPLVDATNHHVSGARFINAYPDDGSFLALPYKPVEGHDECYATYRRLDAMDSWLDYAFIDENAPMMRSVPVKFELEGLGTIHVQGLDGYTEPKELPEKLKGLAFYMPVITLHSDEKQAILSHIFIPQQAGILSMRRILAYTITTLAPDLPSKKHTEYMLEAERLVLQANHDFYTGLKQAANTVNLSKNTEDISHLILTQLKKIKNYQSTINDAQQRLQA